MRYSRIIGNGGFLPKKIVTNEDLEKTLDTSHAWIVERTGIMQRHIASIQDTTSSMAIAAARSALIGSTIAARDLGMIIVATTTPDNFFPSTACAVQAALGISNCPAFDVSAACAGFNYALTVADQFIRTGFVDSALVIGSETMSRILDWQDRSTCILFGDGAGAVLLQADECPGIISSQLYADGSYQDMLHVSSGLLGTDSKIKMRGNEVFKVAVQQLSTALNQILAVNDLTTDTLDWLIPHQANLRIIGALAKKLTMPLERIVISLDRHGNTSSASIPLALNTAIADGRIQKGQLLLLESFGAGFTWGATLLRY